MTIVLLKDYELGLAMLRGRLDPNAERPIIEFVGDATVEPQSALTIPFKGNIESMVSAMQEGFSKLTAHVDQSGGKVTNGPFAAYHKANVKTMSFECDIAVPVDDDVPDGQFVRKSLGGGRYYKVTVQGCYDFLEMAWYSAMSHLQMLKIRQDKSRASLEVYENDPASVQPYLHTLPT